MKIQKAKIILGKGDQGSYVEYTRTYQRKEFDNGCQEREKKHNKTNLYESRARVWAE